MEVAGKVQIELRAFAARANRLDMGRNDVQYSVNEESRGMAQPKNRDWKKLSR